MDNPSMLGSSGDWFAHLAGDPPELSFRRPGVADAARWRSEALPRVLDAIAMPAAAARVQPRVVSSARSGELAIEELAWQLPFGPETRAYFLKPAAARAPLPAVLALHDHAARKWFGKQKVTRTAVEPHPIMAEHQRCYYGERAWANELARRGYAVLVHDVFGFESRRIRYAEVPDSIRAAGRRAIVGGIADSAPAQREPETIDEIIEYDGWAAEQESTIAKSLFSAGTTWPGVALYEDRAALDYLASRPDVDPARLGCGGLSGGGLRTAFLAGTDERIAAAVSAGFLTTWSDLVRAKSFTHTWMAYAPGLPRLLDFPELLGLRAPLPTMALVSRDDDLFTFSEVERAIAQLDAVYAKAGARERFEAHIHPGPHRFDAAMQEQAFAFFDRWLARAR